MNDIKLNEQIAFLRQQKGITQETLARLLGVTNQTISKWESGQCFTDIPAGSYCKQRAGSAQLCFEKILL